MNFLFFKQDSNHSQFISKASFSIFLEKMDLIEIGIELIINNPNEQNIESFEIVLYKFNDFYRFLSWEDKSDSFFDVDNYWNYRYTKGFNITDRLNRRVSIDGTDCIVAKFRLDQGISAPQIYKIRIQFENPQNAVNIITRVVLHCQKVVTANNFGLINTTLSIFYIPWTEMNRSGDFFSNEKINTLLPIRVQHPNYPCDIQFILPPNSFLTNYSYPNNATIYPLRKKCYSNDLIDPPRQAILWHARSILNLSQGSNPQGRSFKFRKKKKEKEYRELGTSETQSQPNAQYIRLIGILLNCWYIELEKFTQELRIQ